MKPEPPPEKQPAKKPEQPTVPPHTPPAWPRPWKVKVEAGSDQAKIDDIRVFLLEPAVTDRASNKPQAAKSDFRHTLSPLLNARTHALVEGRPLRVFLDPGHGGEDSGAVSRDRKTLESHINLIIARRLETALQNAGFEVRLSRTDNQLTQMLEARTAKAFRWKADVFVSIHFNANPSASAHGFETYVLPPQGMRSTAADNPSPATLAQASRLENGNANDVRNMQLGFAIQRRGVRATRLLDRGLRRARFVVLREARMPAVLVECGFLSSARDLKFIRTDEGQEKIVRGLYEGLCDYAFGTLSPGAPATPIHTQPRQQQLASATQTTPPPPLTLPPPIVVDVKRPKWQPPEVEQDPGEDPRMKRVREEAAAAAGLNDTPADQDAPPPPPQDCAEQAGPAGNDPSS